MNRTPRALAALALLPTLALPAPAAAQPATPPGGATRGAQTADFPSAESLFEKYVEAIGGHEAVRRHTSIKIVGTVKVPAANYSAFITTWQAAPDKFLMHIEPPGAERQVRGYDGTEAWSYIPPPVGKGWELMTGEARTDAVFSAEFYGDADYKTRYTKIETVQFTDFNGRKAYRVFAESEPRAKQFFLFFDAETGLILGTHTVHEEDGKIVPLIVIYDEYKEVDGVKYPGGLTQRTPQYDTVFTYRTIEANPKEFPEISLPEQLRKTSAGDS